MLFMKLHFSKNILRISKDKFYCNNLVVYIKNKIAKHFIYIFDTLFFDKFNTYNGGDKLGL